MFSADYRYLHLVKDIKVLLAILKQIKQKDADLNAKQEQKLFLEICTILKRKCFIFILTVYVDRRSDRKQPKHLTYDTFYKKKMCFELNRVLTLCKPEECFSDSTES